MKLDQLRADFELRLTAEVASRKALEEKVSALEQSSRSSSADSAQPSTETREALRLLRESMQQLVQNLARKEQELETERRRGSELLSRVQALEEQVVKLQSQSGALSSSPQTETRKLSGRAQVARAATAAAAKKSAGDNDSDDESQASSVVPADEGSSTSNSSLVVGTNAFSRVRHSPPPSARSRTISATSPRKSAPGSVISGNQGGATTMATSITAAASATPSSTAASTGAAASTGGSSDSTSDASMVSCPSIDSLSNEIKTKQSDDKSGRGMERSLSHDQISSLRLKPSTSATAVSTPATSTSTSPKKSAAKPTKERGEALALRGDASGGDRADVEVDSETKKNTVLNQVCMHRG